MPYILIPIIFLMSSSIQKQDAYFISFLPLLVPTAIILGLRYLEKGLVTLLIGCIFLFTPISSYVIQPFDGYLLYLRNDISFIFILIVLCTIAIKYPHIFLYKINVENEKLSLPTGPSWFILLIPIYLSLEMAATPSIYVGYNIGHIILLPLYLYVRGRSKEDSPRNTIFILCLMLFFSNIIFAFNNLLVENNYFYDNKFKIDLDGISFYFQYHCSNVIDFLIAISFYFLGWYHSNTATSTNKQNIKSTLIYLSILLFVSHFAIGVYTERSLDNNYGNQITGSTYLIYFISFYIGLKARWKGVIVVLITSIFFTYAIPYLNTIASIFKLRFNFGLFGLDNTLTFSTLGSTSYLIRTILISIFGLLTNIFMKDINFKRLSNELTSKSADKIVLLHRFLLFILPVGVMIMGIFFIKTFFPISEITNEMNEINSIFLFIGFAFGGLIPFTSYFIFTQTSKSVIQNNGVLFNRENYPKYSIVHDNIENTFGNSLPPIYVISDTNNLNWPFSKRIYINYSLTNPILLSIHLNDFINKPELLLCIIYRELAKHYFHQKKLWLYTFPLIFVPILNLIYFYARRLSIHQYNLFALQKVKSLDSMIYALTSEASGTITLSRPQKTNPGVIRNTIDILVELLSVRPNLFTQLNFLEIVHKNENNLNLDITKYGYKIKVKRNKLI